MKKKFFKLLAITLAVLLVFSNNVYATDLTDKITVNDSLDITKVEKSYDSENDVNQLKITVTANEEIISRVLNHVAGNNNSPALLGRYYFEFNPHLDGDELTFKKNNKEYVGTLADGISQVQPTIAGEIAVSYSKVWLVALNVQYFDTVSNTWKDVTNTSTGGKSVGQNLSELLGVPQSNLVYGENFRFYMPEGTSKMYGWEIFENGVSTGIYEYLNVTYELNFPISANMNNRGYYYPTLQSAVASGSTDIVINKDLTLDSNVEIPANTTLTIANGVTLVIPEGVSLKLDETSQLDGTGFIEKNGSIFVGNNELFFINVNDSTNGSVTVDREVATFGQEISVTLLPDNGYELGSLKIINSATGEEIAITNGKFIMPEADVEISAVFNAKKETVPTGNPKTSDINIYATISVIVIGVCGLIFVLGKRFAKSH